MTESEKLIKQVREGDLPQTILEGLDYSGGTLGDAHRDKIAGVIKKTMKQTGVNAKQISHEIDRAIDDKHSKIFNILAKNYKATFKHDLADYSADAVATVAGWMQKQNK